MKSEMQQYEIVCEHCVFRQRTPVSDDFEMPIADVEKRAQEHAEFAPGHVVNIYRHSLFQMYRRVVSVSEGIEAVRG